MATARRSAARRSAARPAAGKRRRVTVAGEGGYFDVSESQLPATVRYGDGDKWETKVITVAGSYQAFPVGNPFVTDPAGGVVKHAEMLVTAA